MSRFSQFVALATGHLAHRHSLRDVVANLQAQGPRLYHLGVQPVARSSFARVNETQPYSLYEALFGRLYDRCRHLAPRHGFRFKNKLYAIKIARDWNVRESGSGFVTQFEVASDFLARYDIQDAGGRDHREYWIPAEDMDAFNAAIVGRIEVVDRFGAA